jgi:hypothetical protein
VRRTSIFASAVALRVDVLGSLSKDILSFLFETEFLNSLDGAPTLAPARKAPYYLAPGRLRT